MHYLLSGVMIPIGNENYHHGSSGASENVHFKSTSTRGRIAILNCQYINTGRHLS